MSVKRITIVLLSLLIVGGFIFLGVKDAVKTKDNLEFQKVQLQSKQSDIEQLNIQYEKLNTQLDKASKDSSTSQDEIKKLQDEKQQLENKQKDLESQLQAKADAKSALALASEKTVNTATGTGTASAAPAPSSDSIEGIITAAANAYGLSPSYMIGVAKCESTLNPNSVNYSYYAGGGNPSGLYQFIPSTWQEYSSLAGYGGYSVFNPTAAAYSAAYAFAHGHSGEWACA